MSDLNYQAHRFSGVTTTPEIALPAGSGASFIRLHSSVPMYIYFGEPEDMTTGNSFLLLSSQDVTLPAGSVSNLCIRTAAGTGVLYAITA